MSDKILRQRAIRRFSKHLIVDKGLGHITAEGYCRCLGIALKHIGNVKPTRQQIRRHILWMRDRHYSYSHVVNTSLALEHFAALNGFRIEIGRPRKPKPLVKGVLSEAEVIRIIQAATTLRQRAIVSTLAYSGLRNGEICNLKVSDALIGMNALRVSSGKGSKGRLVSISPECAALLAEYLRAYPRRADAWLFTTIQRDDRLAGGDLRKIVRVLAMRAGVTKRVYPHLFRHSLATNLLNRGASLMLVKEQLGHAFIETTMVYLVSMPGRIRAEYDFCRPSYL